MKSHIGKLLILAPIIISICFVSAWFYPGLSLELNQAIWKSNRPLKYQMQITEMRPDGGPWRWIILVIDGEVVSSQLLEADTHGKSNNQSWVNPANLTVEGLFDFAEQHCVNRGFLDCGLQHDPKYHFPNSIYSYELIIVRVESFTDCSIDTASCEGF